MKLSRGKQCALVALAVVAIGAGMLFRRSPAMPAPLDSDARTGLTRRLPNSQAPERRHVLETLEKKAPRVPTAATAADGSGRNKEFAAHPSHSFHPGGALLKPLNSLAQDERLGDESGDKTSGNTSGDAEQDLLADSDDPASAAQPRTHLVVDGDTLAKLAARYLGNSDRYGEIFAANRGVLTKPDLLPIGTELMIPPRQRPAPPVELSPEDAQVSSDQLDETTLPLLEVEVPPADRADDPLVGEAETTGLADDEALVPVGKPPAEEAK